MSFYVIIGKRQLHYGNSFATSASSVSAHDEMPAVKSVVASFILKVEASGGASEVLTEVKGGAAVETCSLFPA